MSQEHPLRLLVLATALLCLCAMCNINLKYLRTASMALGLALGITEVSPVLLAQSPSQDQQKPQTFAGKVVKTKDGQYALITDEQSQKGVLLDDQEKAKAFEGKNVKVTGVLDVDKNIVHVSDIKPAA
jgi:hypothetical protein